MPKQGKSLEQLVASIERVLADQTTVEIESPKRLRDRTNGELREHDVVLKIKQGHHIVLVAIECRDRSRPIGAPEVEAFSAKCQDTGINQGIMVSPSGFYNSARRKADHLGIRCIDLEEAGSFDWLLASGVQSVMKKLLTHDWKFFPEKEGLVTRATMEVLASDGTPLDMSILAANAQRILNELLPLDPDPTEKSELNVRVGAGGTILRNAETGATSPVRWVALKLTYSVVHEFIPFRLTQYRNNDQDKQIADVAVAELRVGDKTGNLMIVYKKDEGGQIVFVPNSKTDI